MVAHHLRNLLLLAVRRTFQVRRRSNEGGQEKVHLPCTLRSRCLGSSRQRQGLRSAGNGRLLGRLSSDDSRNQGRKEQGKEREEHNWAKSVLTFHSFTTLLKPAYSNQ